MLTDISPTISEEAYKIMDEKRQIAQKNILSDNDKKRLTEINEWLDKYFESIGMTQQDRLSEDIILHESSLLTTEERNQRITLVRRVIQKMKTKI
jgi:hypothetical protein